MTLWGPRGHPLRRGTGVVRRFSGTNQALSPLFGEPDRTDGARLSAAQVMKRMMGGGDSHLPRAPREPSQRFRQDSGGGILDSLFGGGDEIPPPSALGGAGRDKDIVVEYSSDALFGGGDATTTRRPRSSQ